MVLFRWYPLCACTLLSQRSSDLSSLEYDYESKQTHLDVLQGEVVKLEGIVQSISESVRDRSQYTSSAAAAVSASSVATAVAAANIITQLSPLTQPRSITLSATPLYGSPANRLAASAASAAHVARQLAAEEDRHFAQSLRTLQLSPPVGQPISTSLRSPFGESAGSLQRALQSQLSELELEVATLSAVRRR
jgi:hypothetical protein